MWAKDCTTKRLNGVNSLGMLPTEVEDLDKVDLISRPWFKETSALMLQP